jgi:hypothetical protein
MTRCQRNADLVLSPILAMPGMLAVKKGAASHSRRIEPMMRST